MNCRPLSTGWEQLTFKYVEEEVIFEIIVYIMRLDCLFFERLCIFISLYTQNMSRKGPVAVMGMLDFLEDLIKDVNPH